MGKLIKKPSFNLIGLKVEDLSIKLKEIGKLEPQSNLQHNFTASFVYRSEHDIIQLVLKLTISITRDKGPTPIAESTILFDFKVVNIKAWMKGDKLVVPSKVARTFILEGFSTARGIIWSKLLGTPLTNMVIPLIEYETLENKDLEFVPKT